ncbi:MAG: A/G-specific adenine glycosylase [Ancalomicrobiaceae bacterium]|nr:A/G-specific adenine glycosylase [Ancalomicrobiaceae bacterium]
MTTIPPRRNLSAKRASAADLLAWYERHHRRLPWRLGPSDRAEGRLPDPYRVWISEIMLQQTTVAAVGPYFDAFTRRWPTVEKLAEADEAEVMQAWAGLGYYSRARNLKACAERVAADFGGRFPDDERLLLSLPGIGPYTAAAIVAIAFNRRAVVVDGNVERVVSRLLAIDTPLPEAKPEIRTALDGLVPTDRPGEFAEATMDLGATICTPTKPACALCPWMRACAAAAEGTQEMFPVKPAKVERPTRTGTAYVALRPDGAVLLRRRPPRGLLGGMSEVPNFGWASGRGRVVHAPEPPPFPGAWRRLNGTVEHVFTHFRLLMAVERLSVPAMTAPPDGHWWSEPQAIAGEALPTLMRKILAAAVETAPEKPTPGVD